MIEEDSEKERQRRLITAQRVVIKVGTSIINRAEGAVCAERIDSMARLKTNDPRNDTNHHEMRSGNGQRDVSNENWKINQ